MLNLQISQIIFVIATYFIAALPFGVIVSRFVTGKDVRKQGSGNIGATNVARLMGKKWGIFVLFLDALKGFALVKAAATFGDITFCNLVAAVAVGAHCYPLYLKFKGGKGVATALGVLAALSPVTLGYCFAAFVIVTATTRIISAGSLGAALALPLVSIFAHTDIHLGASVAITLLIWWKHRENLKRLLRRQEPKFF